jgi:integrase
MLPRDIKRKVLTDLIVQKIRPPEKGRLELWDASLPGFGIRITDKAKRSWVLMTRIHGKQVRITLGRYPALTVADARKEARLILEKSSQGVDPRKHSKIKRVQGDSFATYLDEYLETIVKPSQRTAKETERIFQKYVLPEWGHMPPNKILRQDIKHLLQSIATNHGPVMANRTLEKVRHFYRWMLDWDYIQASPAEAIKPPGQEKDRDRVLGLEEIAAIWHAAEKEGYPFGRIVQFLICTGQRRSEVTQIKWSEIDLKNKLWSLPREHTKSDRLHEVPLNSLAIQILNKIPKIGDLVFSTDGKTLYGGFSKAKRRLNSVIQIQDWRLHDLRRTMASSLARLNVPVHVLSKLLNHSPSSTQGVTAIYNRHGYLDEKRNALDIWDKHLREIIDV